MHIAGEWVESESGATFEATSPATGEVIGTIPEGTREDAQRAIAAANAAWRDWAARSAFERAAALERVAELIVERRDDLARTLTLDQGKPLATESYVEVDELVEYFRMAAADAKRIEGSLPPSVDAAKRVLAYRVPRGVVGVITPWNWPYTMPAELIAPALAGGNAGERFLVHEAVHAEFVERLAEAVVRRVRLGDPFDDNTTMGPLNNEPTAA